jgi:hypothetical protein
MGTDIHMVVERRENAAWHLLENNPTALTHRNYDMFAMLADVRNGSGFAGIETSSGFKVIAEPRDLPDDLSEGAQGAQKLKWDDDGHLYLGDHSFSWLTLREVLTFDYDQVTCHTGVLTPEAFMALEYKRGYYKPEYHDEMPAPESWSGAVSGGGIITLKADEARERLQHIGLNSKNHKDRDAAIAHLSRKNEWGHEQTYIRDYWETRYMHSAQHFLAGCVKYVKHGLDDVRLVFGFDS